MQKTAVIVAIFVSYLTFGPPNQYLIDIEPIAYSANLFPSFDGPLEHNTILSGAEHLPVKIHGPESLAVWDNKIYTGTFGGLVVRVDEDKVVPIAKIGNGKCDADSKLQECGRPLGIRFNSKGILYVIDAFHGLHMIDSVTAPNPKVTQLLAISATKNLPGGESVFFDDITLDEGAGTDGGDVIYLSDVSTKWDLLHGTVALIEHDKSGRLLKYDINARKVTVAGTDFVFPNGVQITDSKDAVIVCEFGLRRLTRTFIKGPKTGKTEFFAALPGECDNIRRSANRDQETYWVAYASVRNASTPLMADRLADVPLLRKFLVRLAFLSSTAIENVGNVFNIEQLQSLGHSLKPTIDKVFLLYATNYGMITEVNANGKIITAYSSPDGQTTHLSEVLEVKGDKGERILYIGSYSNSYLARLVIRK
ncbi:adipocyte plasma membrane-associated protein-like [Bradysia coprophila]|uniref:adipocyte plasma membrane-associated protein-like n=1 Tax=Bradysia coprophila TaxID=38358 RepID=UPI00187D8737|nr:adipocyte plasma membrane-associated protein-like [Bradysia coprophila]